MALEALDETHPTGQEFLRSGDDDIRSLKAMLKAWVNLAHYLDGSHRIGVGPAADRPAAGKEGNIWILTTVGVATELQYDTGAAWSTLTGNQAIADYVAALAAHSAAATLDHPNESVTSGKIGLGAVLARHLDETLDATSLAPLVNGGDADAFHTHPALVRPASDTVSEDSIDWSTAGGLQQGVLLNRELGPGGNGTVYQEVAADEVQIYIPANANSLEYVARMKSSGSSQDVYCRLGIGATNGTPAFGIVSTSYVWVTTPGAINVSALSGWQKVDIDLMLTSGSYAAYVDRIMYRIR